MRWAYRVDAAFGTKQDGKGAGTVDLSAEVEGGGKGQAKNRTRLAVRRLAPSDN